jgi:hypothetical protein
MPALIRVDIRALVHLDLVVQQSAIFRGLELDYVCPRELAKSGQRARTTRNAPSGIAAVRNVAETAPPTEFVRLVQLVSW